MIERTKRTGPRISEKTTREYQVLMDDGKPVGVCTSPESARFCVEEYARQKNAGKIEDLDAYVYEDESGCHFITVLNVRRMKISR